MIKAALGSNESMRLIHFELNHPPTIHNRINLRITPTNLQIFSTSGRMGGVEPPPPLSQDAAHNLLRRNDTASSTSSSHTMMEQTRLIPVFVHPCNPCAVRMCNTETQFWIGRREASSSRIWDTA